MNKSISSYLSLIGRRGGKKSKRRLSSKAARQMVLIREAKRAFRTYYSSCFWSYRPDLEIGTGDVRWVGEQLLKHGGMKTWKLGKKLCR